MLIIGPRLIVALLLPTMIRVRAVLGFLDTDTNNFSQISSPTTYISTAYVLWHKDGKSVDFISEKSSDQYKLYRFDGNKVDEIVDMSRRDLTKLSGYSPKLITQ